MKEVLGKANKPGSRLPTKLVIIIIKKKKNSVRSEIGIANEFNKFFYKYCSRVGQENPNYIKNI